MHLKQQTTLNTSYLTYTKSIEPTKSKKSTQKQFELNTFGYIWHAGQDFEFQKCEVHEANKDKPTKRVQRACI